MTDSLKNLEDMNPKAVDTIFFTPTMEGTSSKYTTHGIVPFKTIKQQMGGGFDPSGVFVCPQSGIYIFSFSLMKYISGGAAQADLLHNDSFQCRGYASNHEMFGCTANLNLKSGDRVYVKLSSRWCLQFLYPEF